MPYGGGVRAPELHDDSPETYYVHTPGVKVAIPSTPADAKGLLAAAIRDPDPVVMLEPKLIYRTLRGEVPEGEHVVPLGKARLAREGNDLTLVAYGVDGAALRAGRRRARRRGVGRGARHPHAEAARRGGAARVGREDRPRRDRPGGAAHAAASRAELAAVLAEKAILDLRGPGAARDRLRRPVSVLADRGRVHAVGRARRRPPSASCSSSSDSTSFRSSGARSTGTSRATSSRCSTVDAGDSVRFDVPNAGWELDAGEQFFEPRDPELDGGHALAGPIEVRGARRRADARGARRRGRGRVVGRDAHDRAAARPAAGSWRTAGGALARLRSVALRPFLGVLGMPPPEPGVHSTMPPRRWGGNIDCKELVAGTTLFLPIPVDGALLLGRRHARARRATARSPGTAIECPATRAGDARTCATSPRSSGRWRGSPAPG